jgi:hypothetical protein
MEIAISADLIYFILQMFAIVCINTLFFVIMIIFMAIIALLQFFHNRWIQATLEDAIQEARAAFADPETYKKMTKAAILAMQKSLNSRWFQSKKTLQKVVEKMGGSKKKKTWYMALGEVLFSPKKKRLAVAAKNIDALMEPLKNSMEQQQQAAAQEAPGPPPIDLTPEQQKKLEAAQRKILTKEQLEVLDGKTRAK